MKQTMHNQVTPRQATAIVINTIIGAEILVLPRLMASSAGTSIWIPLLVSGLLGIALVSMYTAMGRRFQNSTLAQYCVKTLGPFLGGMLALLTAASWLVFAAMISRLFSTLVITSILPRVSIETSILIMLFLSAHLATQDVKTVARIQELFLPFIIGTILAIIIPSFTRLKLWRLMPFVQFESIGQVGYSTLTAFTAFLGFEMVSIFMPFYAHPEQAGRSHTMGLVIVTITYLLVVVACIGVFGVEELDRTQWPTLELVRAIGFRGVFERLEAPFLAIYVIVIFTTLGSILFGVVSTLSDLFNIKSHLNWPYLLVIPAYFIAIQPQNTIELEQISQITVLIHMGIVVAIPLLILPIAAIRGKEDKPHEGKAANS